ncbi:hypothetical protein DFJ77DRAFT_474159 [Powellomyces hirtus]|nr:hypothetical protein DFJ77DRAFT_474159 [Powellomyces hirtus]
MSSSTPPSRTAGSSAGVQRVLTKLSRSVSDGNYYEAHQMYHSICQRYLKQHNTAAAIHLLHQGALSMLAANQLGSAADLAQRLIDIYNDDHVPVDNASRSTLLDIFHAFPLKTEQCDVFVRNVVKWSARNSEFSVVGDPALHHAIASRYFKEGAYYDAEAHFVYGSTDSARAWGHMAAEWATQGYFPDKGYFVARAVLPYLAVGKIHHAALAFQTFVKDAALLTTADPAPTPLAFESADGMANAFDVHHYPSSALLNLTQLLIIVVQRDAPTQFTQLRTKYNPILAFDPYLVELVEKIAEIYFDLGPKKYANPLEDMMKSLFGGATPAAPSLGQPRRSVAAPPPEPMEMD